MQQRNDLARQRYLLLRRLEGFLEGPMVFLGFVWLALLLVELIRGLGPALELLSLMIWALFILDFIIKFILAPRKTAFLKENWLTVLSLVIPALRVLRFFRVFRVVRGLRLVRVVGSLNRGMRSLGAAMKRRGLRYVILLTLVVIFGGSAGMYAFEQGRGLNSYAEALWWTTMLITSIGSEYWPKSGEGKVLCLLISIYGFCVFGYITATLASFFVGQDAEEKRGPLAGSEDIRHLHEEIRKLTQAVQQLNNPS